MRQSTGPTKTDGCGIPIVWIPDPVNGCDRRLTLKELVESGWIIDPVVIAKIVLNQRGSARI